MPFEIVCGDITKMRVDAIVNAANRSLLGGGGVDGAIHRAAGPELLAEGRGLGGCETGEAKLTLGYRLPARYVIHTVGPIWRGGGNGERDKLAACYRNALNLALAHGCETVAFPLISSGAYGYPRAQALAVAVEAVQAFLAGHDMTVYLVLFGRTEFLTDERLFREVQAYIDEMYVDAPAHQARERRRERLWREDGNAAMAMDQALSGAKPTYRGDGPDWETLLRQADESFSEALMRMIDERGLTDVQCYKRANVDRKLFSKIRSNPRYRPSKPTVFAFAVALELSLEETVTLLERAGFALSHSSKFDIILEYCIRNRCYDVWEINQVLFMYDQPLLGSGTGA